MPALALAGVLAACASLALHAQEPARDPPGPRAVVEDVVKRASDILLDPELPDTEKRQRIEGLVDRYVDFETLCKLVLARNYKLFSEPQLQSFQKEFERHLLYTYWKNAQSADFERIDVLEDREEARGDWTVATLIVAKGDDTHMDYRLRQRAAAEGSPPEWRIIDLIIENVSLVANFRAQFQELLSGKSPDDVIEMLRKKNAEAEAAEKETAGKG